MTKDKKEKLGLLQAPTTDTLPPPENTPLPQDQGPPAPPPPPADNGVKQWRVITDRQPFFNGAPQLENTIIEADAGDEAIKSMLERQWIEEVSHVENPD